MVLAWQTLTSAPDVAIWRAAKQTRKKKKKKKIGGEQRVEPGRECLHGSGENQAVMPRLFGAAESSALTRLLRKNSSKLRT